MESASSSPPESLSIEQLRWKRLVAFGIENAIPIHADDTMIRNIETGTTNAASSLVTASGTVKETFVPRLPNPEREVIDLLDDSSDEERKSTYRDEMHHPSRKRESSSMVTTTTVRQAKTKSPFVPQDEDYNDEKLLQASMSNNRNGSNHATTTKMTEYRPETSSNAHCFAVATWNVWFGPRGDGYPHSNLRMKAIVRLLMQQQNDQDSHNNPLYCIGFQEVVSETTRPLQTLLQQHKYRWFQQPSAPYFCAMAIHSHLTIVEQKWIPYTVTAMQRGFLYIRAKLPDHVHRTKEIIFTTTHLESYNDKTYNGASQRILQIQEMCQYLQEQMKQHPLVEVAMISGDLNWDDERSTKSRSTVTPTDPVLLSSIPTHWKDSWLETVSPPTSSIVTTTKATTKQKVPKANSTMVEGYTYDSKLNPMLGGSLRRRFDRILVCHNHYHHKYNSSPTNPTLPYTILAPQLLGTEVISPDLTWEKYNMYTKTSREVPTAPSDHFGYIVTLRVE